MKTHFQKNQVKNIIAGFVLLIFSFCETRQGKVAIQPKTITSEVNNLSSMDKSVKFFWEEHIYDPKNRYAINDSVVVFRFNEDFLKTISEPDKAVLAYVATFGDSDNCESSNECEKGVKCKIVTALDLGCQCSSKHFDFLHKWFNKKAEVFQDGRCYQRPSTATRRLVFSQIDLNIKGNVFTVLYKGRGNTSNEAWNFDGTEVFQLKDNKLTVLDSKHSISNSRKYDD
jgi:hypothetical protein